MPYGQDEITNAEYSFMIVFVSVLSDNQEQNMFMERNSRFEGGRKDEQHPGRRWGHGGHPGHEDFPNKRRRY